MKHKKHPKPAVPQKNKRTRFAKWMILLFIALLVISSIVPFIMGLR